MNYEAFFLLFSSNVAIYMYSLFFSVLVYYFIFKRTIVSIFDPYTMAVLGSMFAFSTVFFIWVLGEIENFYFVQYILSQAVFIIGFFLFNEQYNLYEIKPEKNIVSNRYFVIYVFVSSIYFFATLFSYYVIGVPLFMNSRLEVVGVGGGFGVVNRILDVYSPIGAYFSLYFVFSGRRKYRNIAALLLLFYCIIILFSGAKSSILGFLQLVFLFFILNRKSFQRGLFIIKKYAIHLLTVCVFGVLVVLYVGRGNNDVILAFLFRLMAYGDTYFMAYPDSVIEALPSSSLTSVLLGDFLRMIRVAPESFVPTNIGFLLTEILYHAEAFSGPNPRHNVFGYVHFGFVGSIIFSFLCGCLLGKIRTLFFKSYQTTQLRKIIYLVLYLGVCKIETDFPAMISMYNNLFIFVLFAILVENLLVRKCKAVHG